LGERLLCKQEVIGSIPFTSTSQKTDIRDPISELTVRGEPLWICRSGHLRSGLGMKKSFAGADKPLWVCCHSRRREEPARVC
jgi:hypothetical protein